MRCACFDARVPILLFQKVHIHVQDFHRLLSTPAAMLHPSNYQEIGGQWLVFFGRKMYSFWINGIYKRGALLGSQNRTFQTTWQYLQRSCGEITCWRLEEQGFLPMVWWDQKHFGLWSTYNNRKVDDKLRSWREYSRSKCNDCWRSIVQLSFIRYSRTNSRWAAIISASRLYLWMLCRVRSLARR